MSTWCSDVACTWGRKPPPSRPTSPCCACAAAALSDMPPRQEHELDPVTLHNQALVGLAQAAQAGGDGGGGPAAAAQAFDKLAHLLAHPPFPPELAGNLLSLCCRPEGPGGTGPSAPERAAVAERLLAEHGPLVAAHVPPELLPLYEACVAGARSPEAARAQLDALAGSHIEGLRRRVKAVQDARWAQDAGAAATALEAFEAALEAYVPGALALRLWLCWHAVVVVSLCCLAAHRTAPCSPPALPHAARRSTHEPGAAALAGGRARPHPGGAAAVG